MKRNGAGSQSFSHYRHLLDKQGKYNSVTKRILIHELNLLIIFERLG